MIGLKQSEAGSKLAPQGALDQAPESVDERSRYLCRACRAPITDASAVFRPGGAPPVQVFTNPDGRVCPVITVTRADGLLLVGPATTEYTWFAGYAWRIALCACCTTHLGWRYEAQSAATPAIFYGLLISALIEESS